jgi:hypothetical protein
MALLSEATVRQAAARTRVTASMESASTILREARNATRSSFDIFLSHSKLDSDLVLGVKSVLESTGKTVYVDWIDDPLLDRSNVTPKTAEKLRMRMRQCKSLFYAHSENATTSRWMPWEVGYFDGFNSNVAILPIVRGENQTAFSGVEYLGLYPYVDVTGRNLSSAGTLYLHRNAGDFAGFDRWVSSVDKLRPL